MFQAVNKTSENAANDAEEEAATASNSAIGEFKGEIEGEQTWLQGLHQFIQQGNWDTSIKWIEYF